MANFLGGKSRRMTALSVSIASWNAREDQEWQQFIRHDLLGRSHSVSQTASGKSYFNTRRPSSSSHVWWAVIPSNFHSSIKKSEIAKGFFFRNTESKVISNKQASKHRTSLSDEKMKYMTVFIYPPTTAFSLDCNRESYTWRETLVIIAEKEWVITKFLPEVIIKKWDGIKNDFLETYYGGAEKEEKLVREREQRYFIAFLFQIQSEMRKNIRILMISSCITVCINNYF